MTWCKRCGVRLRAGGGECVLCGSSTEPCGEGSRRDYPVIAYSNRMRYVLRILGVLSAVAVGVSLFIDYRLNSDTIWSLIVLASTIYAWTSFMTARKSHKNYGLMIFIQLIAVSVLGYVIDYSTGNRGWMLNYVLPFLLVAAQGVITSMMIARPLLFRDVVLYELQIAVMGILSILFMVFGAATVRWPYYTVCAYSAVLLLGTVLLADRKTKQEMIKRFHF